MLSFMVGVPQSTPYLTAVDHVGKAWQASSQVRLIDFLCVVCTERVKLWRQRQRNNSLGRPFVPSSEVNKYSPPCYGRSTDVFCIELYGSEQDLLDCVIDKVAKCHDCTRRAAKRGKNRLLNHSPVTRHVSMVVRPKLNHIRTTAPPGPKGFKIDRINFRFFRRDLSQGAVSSVQPRAEWNMCRSQQQRARHCTMP